MAPKASGSSTMGVKKSTVATSARSPSIWNTAASSRRSVPTRTRGSVSGGSASRTCPSSTGLSLQAQPAPWLYSVRRSCPNCSMGVILAPTPPSADRGDLQAPLDSSLEKGVARELGIRLDQALGFVPHFVQQVGLLERSHRIVCEAVLSRTHQLARATQPHVFFGQLEPVVLPLQQAEPRERLVGRFLGQQQALGLRAAPADPAPELVELREPEAFGSLDHHHAGVRDIEPPLDDRGGGGPAVRPGG